MELGPNVTTLERDGRVFHIIGTAHISAKSVEEVRSVISELRPDTVCVELCETRYGAIFDEDRWKKMDIFQVIREKKVLYVLANLSLSAWQRSLGEKLGVQPGSELRAAVESAEQVDATLILADRDVQATLKRSWGNLSFLDKVKLLAGFGGTGDDAEPLDEERLEAMKDRDMLSEMLQELATALPRLYAPLIDERDRYLATKTRGAPGQVVVSVVGAGHVEGMKRYFDESADLEALSELPAKSPWGTLFKWLIPALILGAFAFGVSKHQGESLQEMLEAWILPNAIMGALVSLIALPKPLSVLTAALASPITSLNPTIGAGMVVGFVEAWLRRPTIEDCERLGEDAASLQGLYQNAFTRVLLVATCATVGSALGAWIGLAWVFKII